MSVSLRLDTSEFTRALAEYAAATGKDAATAVNRQGKNFAIKCIQNTKNSKGAGAIKALQNEVWWPKFIAKVMAKQAGGLAAKEIFQAQWAKTASTSRAMSKQEKSYAKYARKLSQSVLRSRTGAISFLRFFFRILAQKMGQYTKGGSIPGGKTFPAFAQNIQPATSSKPTLKMESAYSFKNRGQSSASSAEKLLQEAMNKALGATIQDMKDYTQAQLAKRSAQFSGRK